MGYRHVSRHELLLLDTVDTKLAIETTCSAARVLRANIKGITSTSFSHRMVVRMLIVRTKANAYEHRTERTQGEYEHRLCFLVRGDVGAARFEGCL